MTEFSIPGLMPIDSPVTEVTPQFLSLEPHNHSDTDWIGISSIGPMTINGETPAVAAERILMEFIPQLYPERECVVFDSEPDADGTITIEDGETWQFAIPAQPLPLFPGLWDWVIRVVTEEDKSVQLYKGQILILP